MTDLHCLVDESLPHSINQSRFAPFLPKDIGRIRRPNSALQCPYFMWFKNLQIYRLTKPLEVEPQELSELLSAAAFVPCSSQEPTSSGWVPPLGNLSEEFVHASNGYIMVCNKRQDKLLPASVVNEELAEKVAHIEATDARSVSRKERHALKEEIIFTLLPQAFAKSSLQFAYFSTRDQTLVLNAASVKKADEFIQDLRKAMGSLPLIPLATNNVPIDAMTKWVNNGAISHGFELGGECDLRDNVDLASVIRCKNQDLLSDEIQGHLKANMHVSKLALSWNEKIECVLDEKLGIKRLRFTDVLQEQVEHADDMASQFDADFALMSIELSAFSNALVDTLGGASATE